MRSIRIFLSAVFLTASIIWLAVDTQAVAFAEFSEYFQIIPSAIQSCLGTTVFWIITTLLLGRVYCSSVCPVGTLQDIAIWARRKSLRNKEFRFKNAHNFRYILLLVYLASLATGILLVGFVMEPWNMMRNAESAINTSATSSTWQSIGLSVAIGAVCGIVSILAILIWSWKSGRAFCTNVCPLGTLLGTVHSQTLMHIAIDPDKCISCMKCENICPSECINVERRFVDNSRCVRCFDCTSVCPNNAIRYQANRGRHRQTPLLNPS